MDDFGNKGKVISLYSTLSPEVQYDSKKVFPAISHQ
jgi:hypothetical protein